MSCRAVPRFVLITRGQGSFLASHQEGREIEYLILGEMQVGHAQGFGFALDFALIINIGLRQLMFKESLVVVPGPFRWTVRQACEIFFIFDRLSVLAPALRNGW